jgi:hypothetical protein
LKAVANQRRVFFFRLFSIFFHFCIIDFRSSAMIPSCTIHTTLYHTIPRHTMPNGSVALYCTQQSTRLIHNINTITPSHHHTDCIDNVDLECTRIYTCIKQVKCKNNQLLDTKKISTIHSTRPQLCTRRKQLSTPSHSHSHSVCLPALPPYCAPTLPSTARPAAACRPSSRRARST